MNKQKPQRQKPMFILQTYEDRLASKELSQKLSERLSTLLVQEEQKDKSCPVNSHNNHNGMSNGIKDTNEVNGCSILPPPPPPLPNGDVPNQKPVANGTTHPVILASTLKPNKTKPKAPPVPVKTSTLSSPNIPPPSPTPDYDTLSLSSGSSTLSKRNGYNNQRFNHTSQTTQDTVEMESLESYRLTTPCDSTPKPPATYFRKQPLTPQLSNSSTSSTASTASKKPRPVSVTIGEYPSATLRKPGRLEFLNGSQEGKEAPGTQKTITSQFASELAQTLNRSNLKKRTESMANCNQ